MKKSVSALLAAAVGVCIVLPAFAACDDEPQPQNLATLTLSAGEYGTLEQTEYLVEVGQYLDHYLADKAPACEEGVIFGGWFDGETQLATDAKMPQEGLSLTAHYKAQCNFFVGAYDELERYSESSLKTNYQWLGETFTYTVPEGYILDETQQSVTEMTVQKGENRLSVYLKPIYYSVTYHGNAPAGVEGVEDFSFYLRYGKEFYLQDYSYYTEEYRFLGWALEPDGEVVYDANLLLMLNDEVPHTTQVSFYRYLELYAKWEAC